MYLLILLVSFVLSLTVDELIDRKFFPKKKKEKTNASAVQIYKKETNDRR
jgi:hypothetical protein